MRRAGSTGAAGRAATSAGTLAGGRTASGGAAGAVVAAGGAAGRAAGGATAGGAVRPPSGGNAGAAGRAASGGAAGGAATRTPSLGGATGRAAAGGAAAGFGGATGGAAGFAGAPGWAEVWIAFRTSPGREIFDRSNFVFISSSPRGAAARVSRGLVASACLAKCALTRSASSTSMELEWVFFSVTPTTGRTSRIALLLTSSSRARSLIRIFCCIPPFRCLRVCAKSSSQPHGD